MDSAVLLKKLIDSNNEEMSLYRAYKDAIDNSYATPEEAFNQCIYDLKMMSQAQYDFGWLTREARLFEVTRRDYRELCDMVCAMLGDKINDLCYQPIYVKPSNFEDYCPFGGTDIVMYCKHPFSVGDGVSNSDKEMYTIEDVKLEKSPYYEIFIHKLEKIR